MKPPSSIEVCDVTQWRTTKGRQYKSVLMKTLQNILLYTVQLFKDKQQNAVFVNLKDTYWVRTTYLSGTYLVLAGHTLVCTYQVNTKTITWYVSCKYQVCIWQVPSKYQKYAKKVPAKYWLYTEYVPGVQQICNK